MKTSRIVIIGIVITIAIASLVFGLNFLKGNNFFQKRNNYYIIYNDIQGLTLSAPVLVKGFKVGKIKDIQLLLDQGGKILVEIDINENINLNDSSVAMIYSLDLMGSKGINLKIGNSNNMLSNGDTIISKIEKDLKEQVSAQMLPLKIKAEELMGSMDSVMVLVQYIFNKTNRQNIDNSFSSIYKTFATLQHTSVELDSILTHGRFKINKIFSNVESITTNLKNNNELITAVLQNIHNISDSLSKANILSTINNANIAVAQIDTLMLKINRGEGTIGQLIHNDTLYQNLNNASKNLDKLLLDVRENPKRYIHYSLFDFGKTIIVEDKEKIKTKKSKKKKSKSTAYHLQIKSSTKRIPLSSRELRNIKNIKEHFVNGLYKYTVGNSNSFSKIKKLRKEMLSLFPDAFVTSYSKDSVISHN